MPATLACLRDRVRILLQSLTLLLPLALAAAPVSDPKVADPTLTVLARDADQRVMEWAVPGLDASGQSITNLFRYTEVSTGMSYWYANEWRETVAEFTPTADGFVAARGPHQVALAGDLSLPGAVTILTADGQTLRNTPALLAYEDRASGRTVRLADLKSSKGDRVAPNPLGDVLLDTMNGPVQQSCRTAFVLGDPTLHVFSTLPVSNIAATTNGNTVVLSWTASGTSGAVYLIYRATSPLADAWTRLNPVALSTTSFTNTLVPSGTNYYLLRAAAIKATGTGSYTNLSQGVFKTVVIP